MFRLIVVGNTEFNIKIDKALAVYLGVNKIKLEELFVIICFNQGRLDILKSYLGNKSSDQSLAYFLSLERKLLMRRISDIESFDWDNYELTDAGYAVFKDISDNVSDIVDKVVPSISVGASVKKLQFISSLTDKFLALWPEGIKNQAGEKIRSNKVDIEKKFATFIQKYKIDDEESILRATSSYLNRMKRNGYAFCNAAHYFIIKDGVSKLATEVDNLSNDSTETSNNIWDEIA